MGSLEIPCILRKHYFQDSLSTVVPKVGLAPMGEGLEQGAQLEDHLG